MSNALSPKGLTLGYATTSNGSYTTVGELTDCPQPEISSGNFEATHYGSTAIEKITTGFNDVADLTFTLNFTGSTQETTLQSLLNTTRYWKITKPNNATYIWQGWISKIGGANPIKGGSSLQITITASIGTLTCAAGS